MRGVFTRAGVLVEAELLVLVTALSLPLCFFERRTHRSLSPPPTRPPPRHSIRLCPTTTCVHPGHAPVLLCCSWLFAMRFLSGACVRRLGLPPQHPAEGENIRSLQVARARIFGFLGTRCRLQGMAWRSSPSYTGSFRGAPAACRCVGPVSGLSLKQPGLT